MADAWTTSGDTLQLEIEPHGRRRAAVEQALRLAIREGRLRPGDRLPSSRTLASDLGLARGTIVEAFAQLEAEGYLSTRLGAGTWVAALPAEAPSALARPEPTPGREARFNFDPGLPDLAAFPRSAWSGALRRGLRSAAATSLGYGDPRGRPELRAALAAYLARARGVVADPELVVVCAGYRDGLSLLSRVLRTQRVESFAMEDPCLWTHRDTVSAAGLRIVPLRVDEDGARTDELASTDAGAVVLAPAHQFPLGSLLTPERRTEAIAWARVTGGLIVEDDYDAELRYDRQPIGALQARDPQHVAYAGTTSKTLAPGLRLGWLVLPPRLVEPVLALRQGVHVSAPEQIAFAELLVSGAFERHIRRMRTRYRRRRDQLLEMLATRVPAVKPVGISAGLRVLIELPGNGPSAEELAESARARSIELFPVDRCYLDGHGAREGLVVGYAALPEHAFESGLAALGDLLAGAH
jgi:GntR family transcriptional regulator/MocR family aminotransferase